MFKRKRTARRGQPEKGIPRGTNEGRRVLRKIALRSLLALVLLIPAGLASSTVAQAYRCTGYHLIPYSDGSWGKTLTTPSGHVVAYTKNATNGSCTGQWYEHMLLADSNYRVELDVWGPQSTWYWMGHWTNAWQDTAKLRIGGTYCAGVHIYNKNGTWLKWQYMGCFNSNA